MSTENYKTTVTLTIQSPEIVQDTILNFGQAIKIKGEKRVHLIVVDTKLEDNTETYSMKPVYRPSPKSTLNNKSVFSKFKMKVLPKTEN